ncbi:MAG: TonB-dependent receptor [Acidobacteriota bacterium]
MLIERETTQAVLGLDWRRRAASGWLWHVDAQLDVTRDDDDTDQRYDAAVGASTSSFLLDRRDEPVHGRVGVRLMAADDRAWRPTFAAQLDVRQRDHAFALQSLDANPLSIPIPSRVDDVDAREIRISAEAGLQRTVGARWRLEIGAAVEVADQRVRAGGGDVRRDSDSTRLLPRAVVTFTPRADLQLRLDLRRARDPLAFDAVTNTYIALNERLLVGNPDLRSAITDRAALALTWQRDGGFLVDLDAYIERRADAVEPSLVPSGIADDLAPGRVNADDDANVRGVSGRLALPLDRLVPGLALDLAGRAVDSSVDDPLTGARRRVDGHVRPTGSITLRHRIDAWNLSWGLIAASAREATRVYVDEIQTVTRGERWSAYVESARVGPLTVRLTVDGLGGRQGDIQVERRRFTPDRRGAPLGVGRVGLDVGTTVSLAVALRR